ncbi:PREDICTED: serine carboxypeptidase-like 44 [Camelina sativa]|uniref:Carboxypeptidase n=1 Tax=Camelina sativa TaxID=90675 RepID=A0ABM0X0Z7_CAMSA|nr:PREDICTED: serine carboxypeptidase-like 44 [Camelina sativa]
MAGGKWRFLEVAVALMALQWWWSYNGNLAEGFPKEDLVTKLPGQPEVAFRQFAGYVDIDVKAGRSLFYYFVEAEKQPHTKPLTLWLNGGPGCSSIGGGAFTELGPFYPTGNGRGLRRNPKSWNKASNLLFVDSPAGVGWSYSNTTSDYTTGDETTAKDMLVFMLRWLEKFPQFKTRNLFLAGESYAGHYIPQLADVILEYNTRPSSRFKFKLKGIAIGNPLLKLDRDVPAIYEFFWSHGMISDELGLTIMNQCDFEDYSFSSTHNISKPCEAAMSEAGTIITQYVNYYDILLDICYPSLVEQELRLKKMGTKMSFGVDVCMSYEEQLYLTLPEVQKALHANRTQLPYEWSMCSSLLNYNYNDGNTNILPILKRIVKSKVPVWVFSGDEDSVIPLLGSRTLVRELADDLYLNTTVPYAAWFHKGQVGGWVIEYGNLLTFATVRGAAHMVPYAQPSRALHLFTSFVLGRRLPHKSPPALHE